MIVRRNSNEALVSKILDALRENDNYCPCRVEKTPDTQCMCKEFRDMIDRQEAGMCHCGLYVIEV